MNCQKARDIFPELLDPRAAASAHFEVRAHLARCSDCQREFAALTQTARALDTLPTPPPSPRLRRNFLAMLEEEKRSAASAPAAANRRRTRERPRGFGAALRWIVAPLGAAVLLLLGFVAGRHSAAPAVREANSSEDALRREVVALRGEMAQQREQMSKMTQLVGYSLLQQQEIPATERMQEVLAAAKSPNPSPKVLDDLLLMLTVDSNVNVRLRALEALYTHSDKPVVREGVLTLLPREQNPLVQLEMIDFVASAHDRNASPVLEKLSQDQLIDRSVRDAAQRALAQL